MGQKISVQDDFYVFPVGDVYYVKFRNPSTRELLSKVSSRLRYRTAANQWAREEWNRRCASAGLKNTPLGDYAKFFFTALADDPFEIMVKAAGRHLGYKTRKDYRADLVKYILPDKICEKSIPQITRADSMNFRDRLIARFGLSRKSKRIFQAYKNVIHTALEKGLTQTDSVIRLGIAYNKKKRPATNIENMKKLMNPECWNNARIRLAVITAGMIGLRAGEIRGIKWRDFDIKTETIHIVRNYINVEKEKLPKWEKIRSTVYPKKLQVLLEPLRADLDDRVFMISPKRGPLSYGKLRSSFNEAVARSGIPKITLHGLRHSIQTALRGRGANPELLRAVFGWEDENVQEGYTHRELYDLSSLREQTDLLFTELTN
jgi:integrase